MLSFTKNRDQPRNRQVCLTTPGVVLTDATGNAELVVWYGAELGQSIFSILFAYV